MVQEVVHASLVNAGTRASDRCRSRGGNRGRRNGRFSFRPFLLGPLDGLAGLVVEYEFPIVSVAGALLARTNTLATMGKLEVALWISKPKSALLTSQTSPSSLGNNGHKLTRRLTARQLAQFLDALGIFKH